MSSKSLKRIGKRVCRKMPALSADRSESIFVENKQTQYPVDIESIKNAVAFVLDEEAVLAGEVTVSFVDLTAMTALNKQYRGIDEPTDVLSFSMTEKVDGEPVLLSAGAEEILGDIVICPEIATENAAEFGHTPEREILEMTIHGLLHLLGHGHETTEKEARMIARQEKLAGMIG